MAVVKITHSKFYKILFHRKMLKIFKFRKQKQQKIFPIMTNDLLNL